MRGSRHLVPAPLNPCHALARTKQMDPAQKVRLEEADRLKAEVEALKARQGLRTYRYGK